MKTLNLFETERLSFDRSIELSAESLRHYGSLYDHWAIAFSGGKDSTATVTLVAYLLETNQIPHPKSLTVLFADTRQELPPLHNAAMGVLAALRDRGWQTRVVLPALDYRYFVYMLGRGVPPPSNTFRWCTPKLKVMSMERELEAVRQACGDKLLMLTGVRLGESAARDQRIALSCSRDGGECGQGWFQQSSAAAIADTLAPLLHWRVCHVWDWLVSADVDLGFPTLEVAEVYGHNPQDELGETEPLNARTGCIGCPLVQEDSALERVIQNPKWAYLTPLKRLQPLYREVKKPKYRLRKHGERRKDGQWSAKQNRPGPLHMEARQWLLDQILEIQMAVNKGAQLAGQPEFSLINAEELARIRELWAANTWPERWDGTEPHGDKVLDTFLADGSIQPRLPLEFGEDA
ncbi:MAG: phosphoadenosine phosphosulfate reductase family protein [Spirulinaceae cyanobacterium SM2_1_0]|nr:phosphoadenosine phosphosulfate reductase family protein [Spirulinaceae cyanobacterium SM2_1_0]